MGVNELTLGFLRQNQGLIAIMLEIMIIRPSFKWFSYSVRAHEHGYGYQSYESDHEQDDLSLIHI